jgi:hypothetical protein
LPNDDIKTLIKLVPNYSIGELFSDQIKITVYRVIALYFHLQNYSHASTNPDIHLASIVFPYIMHRSTH